MNINPQILPSVAFINKETLPNCCGIYFVLDGDKILYIGKSINLLQRWKAHHKFHVVKNLKKSDNIRIAWLELKDQTLLNETESALIAHFKPILNGKNPDISKTIRIKSSISKLIEQEAKRKNMPFLDTLYFIILDYFVKKSDDQ